MSRASLRSLLATALLLISTVCAAQSTTPISPDTRGADGVFRPADSETKDRPGSQGPSQLSPVYTIGKEYKIGPNDLLDIEVLNVENAKRTVRVNAAGFITLPLVGPINVVGLTQQQAEERGHPIKTGKVPFQAIAKAIIGGEYEGFAKVIADKETDETLGIHLIGPHATDLIAEASVAFELEAVPWEIGGATHAHPTLSEILGEAAMNVDGRSINF